MQDKPSLEIWMVYYPNGNLRQLMSALKPLDKVQLLLQFLAGLRHAHGMNIVHRDIKPEKILVETLSPFKIRIADFGEAKEDVHLKSFCGTRPYMAPEIWLNQPDKKPIRYTKAVDIWSLGAVISETLIGRPEIPTGSGYCELVIHQLLVSDLHFASALEQLLLNSMLQLDPSMRANAETCYSQTEALTKSNENSKHRIGEDPDAEPSRPKSKRQCAGH